MNLIKNESNPDLIQKTKVVKGIHFSQINDEFLSFNNLSYYKNWVLTQGQCDDIAKEFPDEDDEVEDGPCQRFYKEKLKRGQIGCLLGHIECWKQIILNNDDYAIVLEDDAWWPDSHCLSSELKSFFSICPDFDIFFLGRKPLFPKKEVESNLGPKYVIPKYSYNSQSYVLSRRGCLKLLSQNPHKNLMSTDEFLSACYSDHPRKDISKTFDNCLNAIALKNELIWQMNTLEMAKETGITWTNIEHSGDVEQT